MLLGKRRMLVARGERPARVLQKQERNIRKEMAAGALEGIE